MADTYISSPTAQPVSHRRQPQILANMKLTLSLLAMFLSTALAQTYAECTAELARTDDCAGVINANACYNKMGFRNAQTLQCIEGKNDAEKKTRVSNSLTVK